MSSKQNRIEHMRMEHVSRSLESLQSTQRFVLSSRLSGILHQIQNRFKRSYKSEDIVTILPNNDVCFVGHKLKFKLPSDQQRAQEFREALNIFITMLSHNHKGYSGHYNFV